MNKKGTQIIISIIVCILAVALTLQVRTLFFAKEEEDTKNVLIEQTQKELDAIKAKNRELQSRLSERQKEYDGRIMSLGDNELEIRIKELYDKIKNANRVAGISEVTGSGIIFTMDDKRGTDILPGEYPWEIVVHNYQILSIIGELQIAGAQAISINGERFISATAIICTGKTININGKAYTPPYEIKAIGDPNNLYKNLLSSEIYNEMSGKIKITLVRDNKIIIPKYSGNIESNINLLSEVSERNESNG